VANANYDGCGHYRQDTQKGTGLVPILVQMIVRSIFNAWRILIVLRGRHKKQYRRKDRTEEEKDPDSNVHKSLERWFVDVSNHRPIAARLEQFRSHPFDRIAHKQALFVPANLTWQR